MHGKERARQDGLKENLKIRLNPFSFQRLGFTPTFSLFVKGLGRIAYYRVRYSVNS